MVNVPRSGQSRDESAVNVPPHRDQGLTLAEAAAAFTVSGTTLRRLVRADLLPVQWAAGAATTRVAHSRKDAGAAMRAERIK